MWYCSSSGKLAQNAWTSSQGSTGSGVGYVLDVFYQILRNLFVDGNGGISFSSQLPCAAAVYVCDIMGFQECASRSHYGHDSLIAPVQLKLNMPQIEPGCSS